MNINVRDVSVNLITVIILFLFVRFLAGYDFEKKSLNSVNDRNIDPATLAEIQKKLSDLEKNIGTGTNRLSPQPSTQTTTALPQHTASEMQTTTALPQHTASEMQTTTALPQKRIAETQKNNNIQSSNLNKGPSFLSENQKIADSSAPKKSIKLPSITINVEPEDSQVKLLDKGLKYKPGMHLRPGEYNFIIERNGYQKKYIEVVISDSDKVIDIHLQKDAVEKY